MNLSNEQIIFTVRNLMKTMIFSSEKITHKDQLIVD